MLVPPADLTWLCGTAPAPASDNDFELGRCPAVATYERLGRIGAGTYGTVYKARHSLSGAVVALKKVILHNERTDGFPVTALREVRLLRDLGGRHSCVALREVVAGRRRDSVFLVFEYCEHDLAAVVENARPRAPFSGAEVKVSCAMRPAAAAAAAAAATTTTTTTTTTATTTTTTSTFTTTTTTTTTTK